MCFQVISACRQRRQSMLRFCIGFCQSFAMHCVYMKLARAIVNDANLVIIEKLIPNIPLTRKVTCHAN